MTDFLTKGKLDDARCTLADAHGYLVRAADMVASQDPGFALSLYRCAQRVKGAATPEVMARWTSTAQTTAEKRSWTERVRAAVSRRLQLNGRNGR